MTLEEATALAQKQADEARVVMIVVKDDLSEDAGGGYTARIGPRSGLRP